MSADRGVTAVVGKLLEVGVVVLFVAGLTATLYGGIVPDYRTSAADEIGERILAEAAYAVEGAVPPVAAAPAATVRVRLPETVRGSTYRLVAVDRALVLEHPHPAVEGRIALVLPERVVRVTGSWRSDRRAVVRVRTDDDRLVVALTEGS